jgi:hypothetical protein
MRRLMLVRRNHAEYPAANEIAPPGRPEEFKTYLEWTAKRKP